MRHCTAVLDVRVLTCWHGRPPTYQAAQTPQPRVLRAVSQGHDLYIQSGRSGGTSQNALGLHTVQHDHDASFSFPIHWRTRPRETRRAPRSKFRSILVDFPWRPSDAPRSDTRLGPSTPTAPTTAVHSKSSGIPLVLGNRVK